ncbi:Endothelin-converting enzyme 1 [Armadillidium nasatum]|uniref:Endothelin-converting enzyme 1 n=1 Tax=Armadillidium nasatum TaxID=96803 RepID=A0A5N5TNK4_9CRUS|nr:Endothelin-converting enzyme 1 [Armadillidium nasatum]
MSTLDHNDMILNAQAERMLQVMNSSVDPCENFYEYACGRWSEVYPLEDKALDNTFDRLREGLDEVLKQLLEEPITSEDSRSTIIAKTLYKGCMDEEKIESLGVTPLKTLLSQLGGWPVLEGEAWNEEAFDWVELMAKLRKYNNDILLSEWVGADVTNSSNHIIQLDQPILGLPGREYFMSAGDQDYRMAYMELMLKTCELLGVSPEKALQDMINVLQFEKQLAKILTPAEERRNLSAIDWIKYFHIIMSPSLSPPSLTSSESSAPSKETEERYVIVFAMKYIRKLVTLIQETSKRTVSNYLMWRFVKNRMNNLGKASQDAKQDFIQILFGSKSQPERWLTCVSYVNGNLGYVLGSLFVKKYYPQTSKKDLDFNESDHFWNVIKMLQFHALSTHDLLSKPVSRIEWTTTPAVVNAYYSRSKNMIMFPAGILQPPFYHPAFPRCLNFGGIGVVIGHEISHGFDDNGRQFDEFGNLQQWWTDEDVSHFYDRATCMLDQYSNYKVTSTGLKINAVNTLGENIADNAGLKIAYKAYQKWKLLNGGETIHLPRFNLTHDQFFFLNFGQIWCEVNSPEAMLTKIRVGQHSPNKYRVIGTLSNSKEFSDAFNCPEKSTMNPKEK